MKQQQNKPATQQKQNQVTQFARELYKGPIPKASEMQQYEAIQPGFANRIIGLTEGEANHRRSLERRALNMNFVLALTGQIFGLAGIAGVIWLCYYAFQQSHPVQAAWIACGVLASVGGVFLWRKKQS